MKQKKPGILAELHEKKGPRGKIYFVGRFEDGGAEIVMFKEKNRLSSSGAPVWELFFKRY